MTPSPLFERKDARGRSKGRTRANARAHSFAQVDHIPGRVFLLPPVPGRAVRGQSPRTRAAHLFLNALHHRTGKFADVAHRHSNSLSCAPGFDDFEARARKGQSSCLIPTKRLPK